MLVLIASDPYWTRVPAELRCTRILHSDAGTPSGGSIRSHIRRDKSGSLNGKHGIIVAGAIPKRKTSSKLTWANIPKNKKNSRVNLEVIISSSGDSSSGSGIGFF